MNLSRRKLGSEKEKIATNNFFHQQRSLLGESSLELFNRAVDKCPYYTTLAYWRVPNPFALPPGSHDVYGI